MTAYVVEHGAIDREFRGRQGRPPIDGDRIVIGFAFFVHRGGQWEVKVAPARVPVKITA